MGILSSRNGSCGRRTRVIHIPGVSPWCGRTRVLLCGPSRRRSLRGNDGDDLRSLDDDLAWLLAAQSVGDGFERHLLQLLRIDVRGDLDFGAHLALDLHDRGDGILSDVTFVGLRPVGVRRDSVWPSLLHSSSQMCGAIGESIRISGSTAARGTASRLVRWLLSTMSLAMAVFGRMASISTVTSAIVLLSSFSVFVSSSPSVTRTSPVPYRR